MASTKAPPSFLTKLSTLREFVTGMGVKASEDELSDQLKNSGHNVELALERILTGSFGGGGGGSSAAASSSASSSSLKKRGSSLLSSSSAAKTPTSSIKRQKKSGSNVGGRNSWSGAVGGSALKSTQHQQNQQPTQRLLLCKRWTVACSKSVRGRVSYGEALDFGENWSNNKSHTPKKGSNAKNNKPVDPMVRFRSKSGSAEGTLNRYLCSVLSPLLRLPASGSSDNQFIPLVSIEGEALMEDRSLVIGCDVPVNLKIYLNDPIAFFELFQNDTSAREDTSSKLFFRKKAAGQSGKLPSYQGKKAKSSFTDGELAEAAFHLLQWAEKGEELSFQKESDVGKIEGEKADTGKSESSSKEGEDDESISGDGDYEEEALESDEVDGLNELVVSGGEGKAKKALSDPGGFKAGVILRPYQRQALHFLCRREGCHIEGEMSTEDSDEGDGELDLLAELASSTHSNADASMQVWGGKSVACDCGPVAVSDEAVASKALPVIEHGRTQNCKETGRKYIHHPLWKRRFLATDDLGRVFAFYMNELLGIASATPPNPPRQCVGGILADAMGLGKTVMLLSLIMKTKETENGRSTTSEQLSSGAPTKLNRTSKRKRDAAPNKENGVELLSDAEDESDSAMDDDDGSWTDEQAPTMVKKPSAKGRKLSRATLVIAPLSLVSQWEEELASKTDLSHHVYYDAGKKAKGSDAFSCVDVVVTTYGTIQSEYASLCKTSGGALEPGHAHPLLAFDWKRIILDEAHGIKNPSTVVSKACCMLKADARWCVTGTPVQNSLQDVYGLLKFLRHEPWCESVFWKNAITNTVSGASTGAGNASSMVDGTDNDEKEAAQLAASAAFGRVRRVLAPIILRRTKDTLSEDGTPILTLPPIDSSIVHVTLSPAEREFYNALLERSQSVFEGFINAGTASKSWFAIFSLLQRLRQACDHVALTVNKKLDTSELAQIKDSRGLAKKESFSSDGVEDGVDGNFLSGLLSKFRRKKTASAQEEPTSFVKQVAETLSQCVQSSEEYMKSECPICLDEPKVEDSLHTPCGHMFCKGCLLSEFNEQQNRGNKKTVELSMFKSSGPVQRKVEGGSCPVCHEWVKVSRVIQIEKSEKGEAMSTYLHPSPDRVEKENNPNTTEVLERDAAARATLESALSGANSSKLEAVLAELDRVWTSDPGSKVLVFSQYLGFLDIAARALADIGVECFRIDGKMSLKERVAMIAKFNKKRSRTSVSEEGACQRGSVFLVSMKAGGVGLNLVAASSVFVLDPWWNQAIEDQCINRIHRIGQQAKVVRVRKFVVNDSVEEKIVALQGKKKGMANEILSDTAGDGQLDSAKPTLEDFKLLFGR